MAVGQALLLNEEAVVIQLTPCLKRGVTLMFGFCMKGVLFGVGQVADPVKENLKIWAK